MSMILFQETLERSSQRRPTKRFLQQGTTLVLCRKALPLIAGGERKGDIAGGELIRDRVAHLTIEIDIKHRPYVEKT